MRCTAQLAAQCTSVASTHVSASAAALVMSVPTRRHVLRKSAGAWTHASCMVGAGIQVPGSAAVALQKLTSGSDRASDHKPRS